MYNPQLETFLAVVESGSFNKAAERLYISPPAVIKQINLLEKSLDLQLFVRTHRGLRLTKAGHSLYQDAKYIIQYCKDSVTRARNAMQESESVIRIGTSPMTPAQVPVNLWPKRQGDCPDHACLHMGRPDSAVPIVFPPNVPAIQFAESAAVSGNGVILR